jgi:hypothetical protein
MLEDFVVGHAEHAESERGEPRIAHTVARGWREVLCSVGFDDERGIGTVEVGDVRTERNLATKFRSIDATAAHEGPERTFGRRRCTS